MKREHKAFLGFLIAVALLIGYGLFANALNTHGIWLWIPVMALVAGNAAAAVKFPQYRRLLGSGIKSGFEAVATYFTDGGRAGSEPKAVPRPIQRKVLARAGHRCQFPKCQQRGRQRLHIHHIDMNPANSYDESNLVVVCPNHHLEIHNSPAIPARQVRTWAKRRL